MTGLLPLGLASAAEVTGLTRGQLSRIEEELESPRRKGYGGLSQVAEALGGEFDFDVLRCVRAGMLRERAEG